MGTALSEALGQLSREDRTLAVVACTLAGRGAPALLAHLPPDRARRLASAIAAALEVAPRERLAVLQREAGRLASAHVATLDRVHPARARAVMAEMEVATSPARLSASSSAPVRAAWESLLAARIAPLPWAEEIDATPPPVRALLRASDARLEAIATALGPSALKSVLSAAQPTVAQWIVQRLAPAWDPRLASAADEIEGATALETLAALTRASPRRGEEAT